jgi:hypothetical protein
MIRIAVYVLIVGEFAVASTELAAFAGETSEPRTVRDPNRPSVTVYLMPNEPAAENVGASISREVRQFNDEWSGNLVVLNTTVPRLAEQLYAQSPEYATPNWAIVKGQRGTLSALKQYAEDHHLTIYVRILTWGQALPEIRTALRDLAPTDVEYPHVMQIGTTWRGALWADGSVLAPTEKQTGELQWEPKAKPRTLPYMQDVRLIWYWRRHLESPDDAKPLKLNERAPGRSPSAACR